MRLLVMVITCVMLPASFLHWISPVQAYWGVIGIIALAILEYLLNSQKSDATYTEYTQNSNPSQPAAPKTAGSQDGIEKRNPSGRARALRQQFEEDGPGPEEDPSETTFGRRRTRKKMHVHSG